MKESDEELTRRFWRDGVVAVRGAVDDRTLAALREVAVRVFAGKRSLRATNGESLIDSYLWLTEPTCSDFVVKGPFARLAATLLRSQQVRLYYDQIFSKAAGSSAPTRWHQDAAHWPLRGGQMCSIWLALENVKPRGGALRYLKGSHAWGTLYRPTSLHDPEKWAGVPGEEPPDFEGDAYRATEMSFALDPGDCAIHHAATVHASHPNEIDGTTRLAYVTRWLGNDVHARASGFSPAYPIEVTLTDGAPVDHPLFPLFDFSRDRGASDDSMKIG